MQQLTDGKAKCKHCQQVIVMAGGTTNLGKHLRRHHKIETQPHPAGSIMQAMLMAPAQTSQAKVQAQPSPRPSTSASASCSADTLPPLPSIGTGSLASNDSSASATSSTMATVTPFTIAKQARMPESKKHTITARVCQYLVKSLRPYQTVEDPYFRAMVHEMNPLYRLPNRHDVSERLIPAMYDAALTTLKQELATADHVSLTGDGWTSRVADHYMTITVHYLKDWQLQCKVLQTLKGEVRQTGENITVEIDECLKDFQLEGKVRAMTTDNARAMINATSMSGTGISLGCFAHILNLAAQKMLSARGVPALLGIIRPVITYFRKSYMGKIVLKEKQEALGLPCNSLILDCKTRWNSTYLMVERFVRQYPAIVSATLDDRIKKKDEFKKLQKASDDDMGKMETFMQVAELLYKMTTAMSSEQKPTAGMVLPMLEKLRVHFSTSEDDNPFAARLKASVREDLAKRYQDTTQKEFLEEATALDPRFKSFIKDESVWDRLCEKVTSKQAIKEEPDVEKEVEVKVEPTEMENEDIKAPRKMTALEEIFQDEDEVEITHVEPPTPVRVRIQAEINTYREMPKIKSTDDAGDFWRRKSEELPGLPLLANLAREYLTIQATSVASERIFSTAGDVVSAERACLDPENVNMAIFLKKNL
ncbi:E3 SUMO-protein ligase ZBED1-like [Branchiostoma floridae x Branchiostoma belcheri]